MTDTTPEGMPPSRQEHPDRRIYCPSCRQPFKTHVMGVPVGFTSNGHITLIQFMDVLKCIGCGTQILSGAGLPTYPGDSGWDSAKRLLITGGITINSYPNSDHSHG